MTSQPNFTWTSTFSAYEDGFKSYSVIQSYHYLDSPISSTVYENSGTSNCVNVIASTSTPKLFGNGLFNPEIEEHGFVTFTAEDIPFGDLTQLVKWPGYCGVGTPVVIAEDTPHTAEFLTAGSSYFQLRSYFNGIVIATSNCLPVRVNNVAAELTVGGSSGPIQYVPGQTFDIYGANFDPGALVNFVVYFDELDCDGSGLTVVTPIASAAGAVDLQDYDGLVNAWGDFAIVMRAPFESSNCVSFNRTASDPLLTANGSTGPFVVGEATEFELLATGLPVEAEAHLTTCSGTVLDDMGSTTSETGEVGLTYLAEEEGSVAIEAGGIRTNCIRFQILDVSELDLILTANNSPGPITVAANELYELEVTGQPESAIFFLNTYTGNIDCSGTPVNLYTRASAEGDFTTRTSNSATGVVSYRASFGEATSDCVQVNVDEPISVTLSINGESEFVELPVGLPLNVVAEGLPINLTAAATLLRQHAGHDCADSSPLNLETAPTGPEGTASLTLTGQTIGQWSFRLDLPERAASSNRVNVTISDPASTTPVLKLNGYTGTVSVPEGLAITLTAVNLPQTSATTVLLTYLGRDCSTPSGSPISLGDGRPVEHNEVAPAPGRYSYRVQSTGPDVSTNCVNLLVSRDDLEQPTGTGSISLTIDTADSGAIPDDGQICLDDFCEPISMLLAGQLLASAPSGTQLVLAEVPTGVHQLTVTGVFPYADASAVVTVVEDQSVNVLVTLQMVASPSPTPGGGTEVPSPTVDGTEPTARPGENRTPEAIATTGTVTNLPRTGSGSANSNGSLAILMVAIVLLGLAAISARRRTPIR